MGTGGVCEPMGMRRRSRRVTARIPTPRSQVARAPMLGLVAVLVVTATACSSSAGITSPTTVALAESTSTSTTSTTALPIDTTADPFPRSDLIGEWMTVYGFAQTFLDDGTWTISSPGNPDELYDAGSWTLEAATLIIVSDLEASPAPCEPGDTGYFEVSLADDGGLGLVNLGDDCGGRGGALHRGLSPAGEAQAP